MADRFSVSGENNVHIIELALPLHLDHNEFDQITEELVAQLHTAGGGKWIIDLSRVDYTGSAGLGLLVNLRQKIKEGGGSLVLCGLSSRMSTNLHACSLDRLFKFAPSRAAAMKM